jgi:hypothetical protein
MSRRSPGRSISMTSVACPSPSASVFTNLKIQLTRPLRRQTPDARNSLLAPIPPILSQSPHRSRHLVQAAAATLGLSERHTYTIVRRCREAGGDLTSLLPGTSSGGRNKRRVAPASETLRDIKKGIFTYGKVQGALIPLRRRNYWSLSSFTLGPTRSTRDRRGTERENGVPVPAGALATL